MSFEKGNKYGMRFGSNNQPKNRGRKKVSANIAMLEGLTKEECTRVICNLLQTSRSKINELSADKSTPIYQAVIAKSLSSGEFRSLMELLRFAFGTSLDITTNGKDIKQEQYIIRVVDDGDTNNESISGD